MAVRLALGAAVAALALALGGLVSPAGAATPCWKRVVDDWFARRLTAEYAPTCYRQALSHLPQDARIYTSVNDDIGRALLASIRARTKKLHAAAPQPVAPRKAVRRLAQAAPPAAAKALAPRKPELAPAVAAPSLFERAAIIASSNRAGAFPLPIVVLAALSGAMVAAAGVSRVVRRRPD